MDIILSVNNRAEVVTLPIVPPKFKVSKPQSLTEFEVVSAKDLVLIGTAGLKLLSFESRFPIEKNGGYSYIRNTSMWGFDYVYTLDTWIRAKLPIRLVITDTDINMAVAVSNFEYDIKTDGDLWYSIEFKEFNLIYEETSETETEELTVSQYEELKLLIENLTALVTDLANPMVYNYIDDNMPEWAQEAVQAAVDAGVLSGSDGGWGLSYTDLKTLTWMYRAGLFN